MPGPLIGHRLLCKGCRSGVAVFDYARLDPYIVELFHAAHHGDGHGPIVETATLPFPRLKEPTACTAAKSSPPTGSSSASPGRTG